MTNADETSATPAARSRWLFYALAIAAWILLSVKLPEEDADAAYVAGYVVGRPVTALVLVLVVRVVYWLVRGRRIPFWTPWIFVAAAVLGLLVRFSEAAGNEDATAVLLAVAS